MTPKLENTYYNFLAVNYDQLKVSELFYDSDKKRLKALYAGDSMSGDIKHLIIARKSINDRVTENKDIR